MSYDVVDMTDWTSALSWPEEVEKSGAWLEKTQNGLPKAKQMISPTLKNMTDSK